MPKDPSIRSVLVIGSGPIVIGQACEFDYSGTQAIKVLRREGIRVSLVNSNPATIMTDPEYADRTYVEPLTPEVLEKILERERPDAVLPTVGGQTALNLAVELVEARRPGPPRDPPDRREPAGGGGGRGPPPLQGGHGPHRPRGAEERLREERGRGPRGAGDHRPPRRDPPVLHPGRHRGRHRLQRGGVRGRGLAGPGPVARPRDPDRGVGPRLEGIRAGGDAGQGRQLRGDLLHRELRPDGHPHRRLGHRGARPDPDRQGVPGDARRLAQDHPRGRRRDRGLQHPVRRGPEDRTPLGHRDEPARLPLLGPGEQGDGLPDRQDRRPPGHRLPARRDPERHHPRHAGVLRAGPRLRRGEDPALGLREVPRREPASRHPDEVGRRGHGHRAHLQGGAPEGAPRPGDRGQRLLALRSRRRRGSRRSCSRPTPIASST